MDPSTATAEETVRQWQISALIVLQRSQKTSVRDYSGCFHLKRRMNQQKKSSMGNEIQWLVLGVEETKLHSKGTHGTVVQYQLAETFQE